MQRLPTPLALCFGPFSTLPADELVRELAENPNTTASRLGSRSVKKKVPDRTPDKTLDPADSRLGTSGSYLSLQKAAGSFGSLRAALGGSAKSRVSSRVPESPGSGSPGVWPEVELGGPPKRGLDWAPAAGTPTDPDPELGLGGAATPRTPTAKSEQATSIPESRAVECLANGAGSGSLAEPSAVLHVDERGSVENCGRRGGGWPGGRKGQDQAEGARASAADGAPLVT